MIEIWKREFKPTYTREDGLMVLNDQNVPMPKGFIADSQLRSNVIFPIGARGGDHVHSIREEVFVGFGEGLELLVVDSNTKQSARYKMDPIHNNGMCIAFYIATGMPHAIVNSGKVPGYLVEFANHPQESRPYRIDL